jgi:dimethylargininase
MLIAITRAVSPTIAECELTHLAREPIDVAVANAQHEAYEQSLRSLGATLVRAPAAPAMPDAVFVEDTAIVLDEVAILTWPGAPSRRPETDAIGALLASYRPVRAMSAPATLDGGDVLRMGSTLYVGRCGDGNGRTNEAGIGQLADLVAPFGYRVMPVDFSGCLHLKSAVTALGGSWVLTNPSWVASDSFARCEALEVDESEPHAANALRVGDTIVYPAHFPRTLGRLRARELAVITVDSTELAKAEGGVTCCSLIFETASG